MSVIGPIIFALLALLLALFLAFVPLRLLVVTMAKSTTARVRAWAERRRERRAATRATPDRRTEA